VRIGSIGGSFRDGDIEFDERISHGDRVTDLTVRLDDSSRDGAGDGHRGLVGDDVQERLVFRNAISRLDMPGHNLGFDDTVA
jgi:hypothetical protein